MCGRYGFTQPNKLKDRYDLPSEIIGLKPRFNIAPGQVLPVIVQNGVGENHAELMKWGLVPFWSKDPNIGYKMINARAEDIDKKPSYKKPLKSQRCLIPADLFYEWSHLDDDKVPYLFKLKDGGIFSFAGLFDIWKDEEGNEIKTYTIITTEPNKIVQPIHNRMPVILKPEDEDHWLSPENDEKIEKLLNLLKTFPEDLLTSYPVFSQVNSPANDYPEIIQPINA